MIDWLAAVSTVGFPIVAFFYAMIRLEKVVQHNTQAIQELRELILKRR